MRTYDAQAIAMPGQPEVAGPGAQDITRQGTDQQRIHAAREEHGHEGRGEAQDLDADVDDGQAAQRQPASLGEPFGRLQCPDGRGEVDDHKERCQAEIPIVAGEGIRQRDPDHAEDAPADDLYGVGGVEKLRLLAVRALHDARADADVGKQVQPYHERVDQLHHAECFDHVFHHFVGLQSGGLHRLHGLGLILGHRLTHHSVPETHQRVRAQHEGPGPRPTR